MLVQPVPQVGLDSPAAAVEQLAHAEAGHPSEQGDGQKQGHGDLHLVERVVTIERVDPLLQEPGAEGGEKVGDDDQGQAEGVGSEVGPQEGQQRPQLVHSFNAMSPP